MKLLTKRLILIDRFSEKEIPCLIEAINDKEIWYFTSRIPYPYTKKDAKKYLNTIKKNLKKKPRVDFTFFIKFKGKKEIIGSIGLHHIDYMHKKCIIGYWLDRRYRKQGIISEAEEAVLNFAFKKLKLNKIKGEAMIENKGSIRLFKKFGFRKVGLEKEELIKKGKKKDAYLWELLRSDFKK